MKTSLKLSKKSFNLDQSQVCITNGFEAKPCKEKHYFAKMNWDCETETGTVFTQTNAISKRNKVGNTPPQSRTVGQEP